MVCSFSGLPVMNFDSVNIEVTKSGSMSRQALVRKETLSSYPGSVSMEAHGDNANVEFRISSPSQETLMREKTGTTWTSSILKEGR